MAPEPSAPEPSAPDPNDPDPNAPDRTSSLGFPAVAARSLTGVDLQLPAGFGGRLVVAVIAFRQGHQRLVDSWAPHLDALADRIDGLRWYELPVLGRQWAPLRPFIDGGMARGIADEMVCARTLTVYGDVGRVCRPLGITDRTTITTLLTDRAGQVHWRSAGGATATAIEALTSAAEALSPPGS